MQIEIEHIGDYRYNSKVFLEPHLLRILPRPERARTITEKHLYIEPQPAGVSEIIDLNNNPAYSIWFCGLTNHLCFRSHLLLDIGPANPFDFLIYPGPAQSLPMVYDEPLQAMLAPALAPLPLTAEISAWTRDLLERSKHQTLIFLTTLCSAIQQQFRYESRNQGRPLPPENTWSQQRGSCRDFALLAMAVCRELGLATRFVSGYYFMNTGETANLHAWIEVYLPGGGWRGFDPTHGMACYEHHIPLASAADPEFTTPFTGHYRGFAQSQTSFSLKLTRIPANLP